jgi:hypothetical protein
MANPSAMKQAGIGDSHTVPSLRPNELAKNAIILTSGLLGGDLNPNEKGYRRIHSNYFTPTLFITHCSKQQLCKHLSLNL